MNLRKQKYIEQGLNETEAERFLELKERMRQRGLSPVEFNEYKRLKAKLS